MGQDRTCIDALRIADGALQQILDRLNRTGDDPVVSARRGKPRAAERHLFPDLTTLIMTLMDGDTPTDSFMVVPRNLSTSGMAVLHGSFVCPGKNCQIKLRNRAGKLATLNGMVVRCVLVSGRVHDLGIHFAKPISVGDFIVLKEQPSDALSDDSREKLAGLAEELATLARTGGERAALRDLLEEVSRLAA